jgi:hypothetical protein
MFLKVEGCGKFFLPLPQIAVWGEANGKNSAKGIDEKAA